MTSKHFNSKSDKMILCPCGKCRPVKLNPNIYTLLELVRAKFNKPVNISSGYRCKNHNATIKNASPRSQHIKANAVDIYIKGVDPVVIYSFLTELFPCMFGFGLYSTFVHIDARDKKARWNNTGFKIAFLLAKLHKKKNS